MAILSDHKRGKNKIVVLSDYERNILEKFKNGGDVETKEEWDVLTKWGAIGLVTFGFLSKRAQLTDKGKMVVEYY